MKIKEVVLSAARLLGIEEEVAAYFADTDTLGKKNAELLTTCFHLVENELAIDYLPLINEETYSTETGQILYSWLQKRVLRVLEVRNLQGDSLPFKIFPKYLTTQPSTVCVRYTFVPEEKDVDGECEYGENVSKRLLAFGVATEYCLAMGLFEEAAVWDRKYKDAIESVRSLAPYKRISSRRWI